MIQYFIIASIYIALFYLMYYVFIRRDTYYRRNRLYLLISLIVSLIVPLIKIQVSPGSLLSSLNYSMSGIIHLPQVTVYSSGSDPNQSNALSVLLLIYLTGCTISFSLLLTNFLKLISYIRKYRVEGSKLVITPPDKASGFSALGYVFLSSDLDDNSRKTILNHEQIHNRNKHFIDILLLRTIGVFFWFNPFVYMYERSLKELHEFETDQQMLDAGHNVISYQQLLMNQLFNTGIFTLQSGFSGRSLIKKRMIMMTKKRSNKRSALKLLLAAPFILFAFGYFSCTSNENSPLETLEETDSQEEVTDMKAEEQQLSDPVEISEDDKVFTVVHEMPTFQGGDINKFREWVQRNVKYPDIAKENGIQGKVFVQFVVDNKGSVRDITILRGVDPSLDNAVIDLIDSSPEWKPGIHEGKEVPVSMTITVNFQLQ